MPLQVDPEFERVAWAGGIPDVRGVEKLVRDVAAGRRPRT
jgi:hypothetical protein